MSDVQFEWTTPPGAPSPLEGPSVEEPSVDELEARAAEGDRVAVARYIARAPPNSVSFLQRLMPDVAHDNFTWLLVVKALASHGSVAALHALESRLTELAYIAPSVGEALRGFAGVDATADRARRLLASELVPPDDPSDNIAGWRWCDMAQAALGVLPDEEVLAALEAAMEWTPPESTPR